MRSSAQRGRFKIWAVREVFGVGKCHRIGSIGGVFDLVGLVVLLGRLVGRPVGWLGRGYLIGERVTG